MHLSACYPHYQYELPSNARKWLFILAYLIALILTILNPLACLIHCATIDMRLHQVPTHTARDDGISFYLCEMLWRTSQPSPKIAAEDVLTTSTATNLLPRSVYEGVASAIVALFLLTLLITSLKLFGGHLSHLDMSPLSPPPRAA